jgi:hypothetical protein
MAHIESFFHIAIDASKRLITPGFLAAAMPSAKQGIDLITVTLRPGL